MNNGDNNIIQVTNIKNMWKYNEYIKIDEEVKKIRKRLKEVNATLFGDIIFQIEKILEPYSKITIIRLKKYHLERIKSMLKNIISIYRKLFIRNPKFNNGNYLNKFIESDKFVDIKKFYSICNIYLNNFTEFDRSVNSANYKFNDWKFQSVKDFTLSIAKYLFEIYKEIEIKMQDYTEVRWRAWKGLFWINYHCYSIWWGIPVRDVKGQHNFFIQNNLQTLWLTNIQGIQKDIYEFVNFKNIDSVTETNNEDIIFERKYNPYEQEIQPINTRTEVDEQEMQPINTQTDEDDKNKGMFDRMLELVEEELIKLEANGWQYNKEIDWDFKAKIKIEIDTFERFWKENKGKENKENK